MRFELPRCLDVSIFAFSRFPPWKEICVLLDFVLINAVFAMEKRSVNGPLI
jgi:hypothetical protein